MTRLVATFFCVGLLPVAPGTWASLAALPCAWALHWLGGFPLLLLATLAAFAAGFWATRAELSGAADQDPGEIVIDEVAGQWIALFPLSAGLWAMGTAPHVFPWPGWLGAFLMFRLFDVWKPWPVSRADAMPGALGVMLDDAVAGLMAGAAVALAAAVAHGWFGMIAPDLARTLVDAARARGWMVTTAESCTGGLVAAAITDIAGSSDAFDRGFVTYSYAAKTAMLGVPEEMLAAHGAVSEPVARAMAEGALAAAGADLAVAITGVAGPGASEAKPEGLVWFATATREATRSERRDFGPQGRETVRARSVETALTLALEAVTESY